MKKKGILFMTIVLAVLFAGCGSTFETEESAVSVGKKGSITGASIESFDKEYYSEKDLKQFIDNAVETYTEENGKKTVKVTGFEVKDRKARLFLEYKTAEDYAAFNGETFFSGTLPDAMAEAYDFSEVYYEAKNGKVGKAANRDSFLDNPDLKVVIMKEKMNLIVPGTIRYVSDNVTLKDENMVVPLKDEDGKFIDDDSIAEYITVIYE